MSSRGCRVLGILAFERLCDCYVTILAADSGIVLSGFQTLVTRDTVQVALLGLLQVVGLFQWEVHFFVEMG